MKKDSIFKFTTIILGFLLILWLVKQLFFPYGFGIGINIKTNLGGGSMNMGAGLGFGSSMAVLLTYLIKFLFIVFVVGLVGGLLVTVKNYVFTPEDIENFKAPFKGNKTDVNKARCEECGKKINIDWKACPFCGISIEK